MAPSRFGPAVVTGAAGFIGACLVRRLLELGLETHALVRPDSRRWRLQGVTAPLPTHDVDLSDAPAVRAVLQTIRPGVVFHLAAHGAYESQSDARRILATDVLGTYNVLDAAVGAGVRLFVNVGSSSEYGFKAEAMRETDRLEPNSVYAVAKAAQTHLCALYGRMQDTMGLVTFRLFSVYGPWEEPTRLFPTLLRRARAGLPLEMVSPETARDFVYVDDVLDAFVDLERLAPMRGEVFNLGSGVQSTMADVVDAVQAAVGRACDVRWGAMAPRKWDTNRWHADPSRAAEILGWRPRYSLRDGVARMAAWTAATEGMNGAD